MSRALGKRDKGRRVMAEDIKDTDFYAAFDGVKGRPEGFYLDMKERHDAEDVRAKMEGREPNHENEGSLPAAVGTQLRVEADRVDNSYYSNPAIQHMEPKDVDPITTLPVDLGEADQEVDLAFAAQVARERQTQDDALVNATDGSSRETSKASEVDDVLTESNFNTRDTTVEEALT